MDDKAREERLLRRMRSRKLRNMGRPISVLPHEYEEGVRILRYWHDERGMSYEAIGQEMGGIFKTTVQKIPHNKTMRRDTYNALKRVTYVMPPRPDSHRRSGAHVDVTGTRRRLQALARQGYTQHYLADYFGMDQRNLSQIMLSVRFVFSITATDFAQGYEKLAQSTPEDMGVEPVYAHRARLGAAKKGYAPPSAWDDDTIDDPAAGPEWTGACGSEEGYRIHVRETVFNHNPLPLCDPCREAVETRSAIPAKPVFKAARFAELLDEQGTNPRALALRAFGSTDMADSMYRWRQGTRNPSNTGLVEPVAQALGVPLGELLDLDAMQEVQASREQIGHGKFNPYVLRVALEIGGISMRQAAEMSRGMFTIGSVTKWLSGQMRPSSPDKLVPLAEHFGVSVDVFFS